MLESVGIAFVVLVVAVAIFCAAFKAMDDWNWWPDAGLAGIIPMAAISAFLALCGAGVAVWLMM